MLTESARKPWLGKWGDSYVSRDFGGSGGLSSPIRGSSQQEFWPHNSGNDAADMDEDGADQSIDMPGGNSPAAPAFATPRRRSQNEPPRTTRSASRRAADSDRAELSLVSPLTQSRSPATPCHKKTKADAGETPAHSSNGAFGPAAPPSGARMEEVLLPTCSSIEQVRKTMDHCVSDHKAMLHAAWIVWLDERRAECKQQPFTCAEHFFAEIYFQELNECRATCARQ